MNARVVLSSAESLACGIALIGSDSILAFAAYPSYYWKCFPPSLTPAWTLGAELTFYLLAPFVLRHGRLAIGLFVLSAALRLALLATVGDQNRWTYLFFPASVCFFLLGHHARVLADCIKIPAWVSWALLALAAWLSLPSAVAASWQTWHFYVALIAFAAALPGVFESTKSSRVLNWIGDLSYPLYLTHVTVIYGIFDLNLPAGAALSRFAHTLTDPQHGGAVVTAAVASACVLAAIAVHYAVERPVGCGMNFAIARLVALGARSRLTRGRLDGPAVIPEPARNGAGSSRERPVLSA